jgi:hypothetical protein
MIKDTADQQLFVDEADDLNLRAAPGAFQRINFPYFFDALTVNC